MIENNQIQILISTYNGAEYLGEQLESIVTQDTQDWHIIVRDDGSEDGSVRVLEAFASSHPGRITILSEPQERLGIVGSFECLLRNSSSPYIVFCDQDDVWFPDKLSLLREAMQQAEETAGKDTPILIHSDLQVVDQNLREIADSFWRYQKLRPAKMHTLEGLLVQNCVTGCATLVNRSLVDYALPIPEGVIMHDWWFVLLAASSGQIKCINAKTVKYRQHSKNDTGAKKWSLIRVFESLFQGRQRLHETLAATRGQARALLSSGKLNDEQARVVSRYINLFDRGYVYKRFEIIRMRFIKYGLIRNIGLILRV